MFATVPLMTLLPLPLAKLSPAVITVEGVLSMFLIVRVPIFRGFGIERYREGLIMRGRV